MPYNSHGTNLNLDLRRNHLSTRGLGPTSVVEFKKSHCDSPSHDLAKRSKLYKTANISECQSESTSH